MGPEQGITLPGMTIVCGDSHTATHGAFGALAFGIGTSEVEHVMATQTLKQARAKTMKIEVVGKAPVGITAKISSWRLLVKLVARVAQVILLSFVVKPLKTSAWKAV